MRFFVFFFLCLFVTKDAYAVICERYKLDTSGFASKAAAESFYPENLYMEVHDFKPKGGNSKQMVTESIRSEEGNGVTHRIIYSLLPNGKMIVALQQRANYKAPGQARYKCNATALEVREFIEQNPKDVKPPQSSAKKSKEPQTGGFKNLPEAEKTCKEIGYTKGTEKFADCVMKLI